MKLFIPKQHGAWAMLIIPYWLGVAASDFIWQHIPAFLGWICLYLATYPMLLLFKKKKMAFYLKWTIIYLIPSVILLFIPFYYQSSVLIFGLLMIPFFMINIYFSVKKQDRAFGNDVSAIISFSVAGLASSYLPSGEISSIALMVSIGSTLFFIGSTFYIKSVIREKKNERFKWFSWIYHAVIVILCLVAWEWIMAIAFIASLIRAIVFYGKSYSIKKIGIYEIGNAVIFFVIMLVAIKGQ